MLSSQCFQFSFLKLVPLVDLLFCSFLLPENTCSFTVIIPVFTGLLSQYCISPISNKRKLPVKKAPNLNSLFSSQLCSTYFCSSKSLPTQRHIQKELEAMEPRQQPQGTTRCSGGLWRCQISLFPGWKKRGWPGTGEVTRMVQHQEELTGLDTDIYGASYFLTLSIGTSKLLVLFNQQYPSPLPIRKSYHTLNSHIS